jgi:hypothetical protein
MGLEVYYKPGVGKRLRPITDDAAEAAVKAGTHVRVGRMVQQIDAPEVPEDTETEQKKYLKTDSEPAEEVAADKPKKVEDKPKKAKPKKAP